MEKSGGSCVNDVGGSWVFYFLVTMIMISIISLLLQTLKIQCHQKTRRLSLQNILRRRKSSITREMLSGLSQPMYGLLNLDSYNLGSGKDVPFHLVKQLSHEMTCATRNYLKKMDDLSGTECMTPFSDELFSLNTQE